MILVGIGSNLYSRDGRSPYQNCQESLKRFSKHGIYTETTSSFFESKPVSDIAQPWYINLVTAVKCHLDPFLLIRKLMEIELEMGRNRTKVNGPRIIDLDLLAYDDHIIDTEELILPHPRMSERAFVLNPLVEIAPNWVDPLSGDHIKVMINALSSQQIARPIHR